MLAAVVAAPFVNLLTDRAALFLLVVVVGAVGSALSRRAMCRRGSGVSPVCVVVDPTPRAKCEYGLLLSALFFLLNRGGGGCEKDCKPTSCLCTKWQSNVYPSSVLVPLSSLADELLFSSLAGAETSSENAESVSSALPRAHNSPSSPISKEGLEADRQEDPSERPRSPSEVSSPHPELKLSCSLSTTETRVRGEVIPRKVDIIRYALDT